MNISVIDLLRERSAKYHDMVCKWNSHSFSIEAKPGGFPIHLEQNESSYTVYFSGWHESFTSA
jgi:hypothetical protein